MSLRWRFEKAIMHSDLDASARLVALTLVALADNDSGVIPARRSPSLSDIARFTGLSAATVKRRLAALETGLWVVRRRTVCPDGGTARTTYGLVIPAITFDDDPLDACDKGVAHGEPGGAQPEPGGGSQGAGGGGSQGATPLSYTLIKDPLSGSGSGVSSAFPRAYARAAADPADGEPRRSIAGTGPRRLIVDHSDATPDEAEAVVARIRSDVNPRNTAGFVKRLITDGDLQRWVSETRDLVRRADLKRINAERKIAQQCRHGEPGGDWLHPTSSEPWCLHCRIEFRSRATAESELIGHG